MTESRDFTGYVSYNPDNMTPEDLITMFSDTVVDIMANAVEDNYTLDWGGFILEQDVNQVDARSFGGNVKLMSEKYGSLYMSVRGIKNVS